MGSFANTGIAGLDSVLGGGFPRNHACVLQGNHGSGKTTLGLQFCITGARQGERALYLSTCESEEDLREIARSHGWSLDGVQVHYHDIRRSLGVEPDQSIFHPAEVELPRTIDALLSVINDVAPERLVIDSLSEIRLVAGDPRWFRRQLLALKDDLAGHQCTTLLCDSRIDTDQPVQSIVHGVVELEQLALDYGPDRRRLRVAKLRATDFTSGYHDFKIHTGGIQVYPRLVAAEHRQRRPMERISSGLPELDRLFGGGADRGTATLLLGPAGTGKSTVASQFVAAAAGRLERSVMYIFDERVQTLLTRAADMGLDLEGQMDRGLVEIRQVDPAELTPGEFCHEIYRATVERDVKLVVIDSLDGYVHAMPNERLLTLHLHELLAFLGQQGVSILMVMAQHGLPGTRRRTPFDVSYIADSVLLFHMFEHTGEMRKAISVHKRRAGAHEPSVCELRLEPGGIRIGEPLRHFRGILTGVPNFTGGSLPHVDDD